MGAMKQFYGSPGRNGLGTRSFLEVDWFFDKKNVLNSVDKASRRVLSRFGSFVRKTARQSIRRPRRKPVAELSESERREYLKTGRRPFASSKPGEPPRNQTGLLKGHILFWYNRHERSVAIGPAKFRSGDIPGTLEVGGPIRLRSGRTVRIAPRPYMGPALDKELPKLEPLWANSVR